MASESALKQLERHPAREVLLEVNVAGEEGNAGAAAEDLARYIELCPVPVSGVVTMPPFAEDPDQRPAHFARPRSWPPSTAWRSSP